MCRVELLDQKFIGIGWRRARRFESVEIYGVATRITPNGWLRPIGCAIVAIIEDLELNVVTFGDGKGFILKSNRELSEKSK